MEPFLYNGFNLVTWQSLRKTEYCMERLHILETGFAGTFPPSFNKFPRRVINTNSFLYINIF